MRQWWETTNAKAPYPLMEWGRRRKRPKRTAADRIAACAPEGQVTPRYMLEFFEDGEYCRGEIDDEGHCGCNPRTKRLSDAVLQDSYGVTWDPTIRF